ncbi:FAD-dependent oxidoreductase, partial [Vibrio parahaemolyticus]|nr:FAD-dependent oxidoreductase [Vibrio parahaemolyticus]
ERTAGAIGVKGFRPAGVYNAGMAQRLINMEGYLVGKEVVIYGSGDIGLIMARRMTLEGAKVKAVVEIMPHSSGLNRNIHQCLNDFNIPLLLSHKVTEIHGKNRVEGVTIAKVDDKFNEIDGTREYISCDTLLLSVGLIPENEISQKANVSIDLRTRGAYVDSNMQTEIPGIFSCGNVLHVHDIV